MTSVIIMLSILAVIGGMVLNYYEFSQGYPATVKNLVVTFTYMSIWIFVLLVGIKNKNPRILTHCLKFWILTLFFLIILIYANSTMALLHLPMPFVFLFCSQWYGFNFLSSNFLIVTFLTALISLLMVVITIIYYKRIKAV
ncbi:UNVERIFIED_CONTAM: hypothetical protein Cloal_0156 [Acetivibrio alkalicellulosi]